MLINEYKQDEEKQLQFKLLLELIRDYAMLSENPSNYKRIAENHCKRIRIVGPKESPTYLVGFRRNGEYFNSKTVKETRETVKRYIHQRVLADLENGTIINNKHSK
jgi:hypothetical protein